MASGLQFYSLGIVAKDKVKDSDGNITSLQIKKSKSIPAEWLPNGYSNRMTPPDVTKGMTVMIYNYAGEKKYYWTTIFNELDLTKREKVVYAFSNKEKVPTKEELNQDGFLLGKTYYLQVDTYDKFIRLHTNKNEDSENPEAVVYDLELDTANGVITVKDDLENSIEIKSQDGIMTIALNKDYILGVKENITLTADKTYSLTAKEGITIKTDKNVEVDLDKIRVTNSTAELIDLLCQLIQANISEQHLGNMGAPTALMASSVQKYQEILQKLQTFKI